MNPEEQNSEEKTTGVVKAVTDLAKTVPIYQDSVQPAAKEIGKQLQIIAKTINIALSPIKALVWSYEKLEHFISNEVAQKLASTPEADIQTPKANIAVPAMQGLMLSEDEPELQELFANLLAAAIDKITATKAHPAFIEAIKQMTPDEAKLMRYFATANALPTITIRSELKDSLGGSDLIRHYSLFGIKANCQNPELATIGVDNLIRLGLITIQEDYSYVDKSLYDETKSSEFVVKTCELVNKQENRKATLVEEMVVITELGQQFIMICINDHRTLRANK